MYTRRNPLKKSFRRNHFEEILLQFQRSVRRSVRRCRQKQMKKKGRQHNRLGPTTEGLISFPLKLQKNTADCVRVATVSTEQMKGEEVVLIE